ncbi:MAG TPA: cupin domain-containing protein [Pyrinomonadaceae bacterium]|nr:cupin domain-containing protein [Pyrinomonadaceae bacterium]
MAIELEGGCRVSEMNEGNPEIAGSMKIWRHIGRATGAKAISLRVIEFAQGQSPLIQNDTADEVFYYLEQIEGSPVTNERCKVEISGYPFDVKAQTGIYLQPGSRMTVRNQSPEPVIFVGVQCPEIPTSLDRAVNETAKTSKGSFPGVRLADRAAIPTANRWYRVLVDDEVGSRQVTQFVGSIPPGRAPDHFHQYEEVLFILRGQGRMWAGETSTPIGPGSCVYLPKGQVHCVENTGTDELRLLGVFYPAGSPAVRYED